MSEGSEVQFRRIVAHGGSQTSAFEALCCQLAHVVGAAPKNAEFQRNGPGADLGVECLWILPDGSKWGWQAKFVFDVVSLRKQVDESLESALGQHRTLTKYTVCFPFDPSVAKGSGRGKTQWDKLKEYKVAWEGKAANAGVSITIEYWPAHALQSRLIDMDAQGGRRLYWFGQPVLTRDWFDHHVANAIAQAGPRYTPELAIGKGRVERANSTLQNRLVKELRLANISSIDEANRFASEFMEDFNKRFAHPALNPHDAHRPLRPDETLQKVFTWQETRKVNRDEREHARLAHDVLAWCVQSAAFRREHFGTTRSGERRTLLRLRVYPSKLAG
jgi:hypothetical protein